MDLMTTSEVASFAGVSDTTVRRWAAKGLPHTRLAPRVTVFEREVVADFVARRRRPASPNPLAHNAPRP